MYYGLYKKDIFSDAINFLSRIFVEGTITDTGIISAMLKRGKLICDETSFFFWMKPRLDADIVSEYQRMSKMNSRDGISSPFFWIFASICDCYVVTKDIQLLQDMPQNFHQISLDIFIRMCSSLLSLLKEKITLTDIPLICPEYLSIRDEVFYAITDYLEKQEERKKQEKQYLFSQCVNIIKKMIKCILPYGLVRLIQEIKKMISKV
jgi:hypothetical protein